MITLKQLLVDINTHKLDETTVPQSLWHIPEQWKHHADVDDATKSKINSVMTNGKQFTTFPLQQNTPEGLEDHLESKGYKIKDLEKGIATKVLHAGDPNREKTVEQPIESVLNSTKAHPTLISNYRKFKNSTSYSNPTGLHVVISTHPMAIAGMSTGTEWKNNSCMNMEKGGVSRELEKDSKNGTHVAFLVHESDKTAFDNGLPSNPIARIALKPFHSTDGDTIFRPENKIYGGQNGIFNDAVSSWSERNYPAKYDTEYHKNKDVYDDTYQPVYKSVSPDKLIQKVDNGEKLVNNNESYSNDAINTVIKHGVKQFTPNGTNDDVKSGKAMQFISNASKIGDLTTGHIGELNRLLQSYKDNPEYKKTYTNLAANQGHKFSTKIIRDYADNVVDGNVNKLPTKMLMSPNLPDDVVDKVNPDKYEFMLNSKVKDKHLDKIVDDFNNLKFGGMYNLQNNLGRMGASQIDKIVKGGQGESVLDGLMNHPEFNRDHYKHLLNHAEYEDTYDTLLGKSKFANYDDAVKSGYQGAIGSLMKNRNLDDSEYKRIKTHIVDGAKKLQHGQELWNVDGFNQYQDVKIPNSVKRHLTPSDTDVLSKLSGVRYMDKKR